jgi:hypothetical protein
MVALCHGASDELKKDMFWMQKDPHHYPLFEPICLQLRLLPLQGQARMKSTYKLTSLLQLER